MFQIQKATKEKLKLRLALAGASGSGKTYSALQLASGITSWDKVVVIDTEQGSSNYYNDLGEYNVLQLDPPYKPERYIEAIQACENAGMEVIIIDSISHEWEGKGGILEEHSLMTGNSFTNWKTLTPRHNKFIDAMLHSKAHVIATMRTKQDYVIQTNDKGKQAPEKVGLKAVTRDGVDYEFTIVFDVNQNHYVRSSKDRSGIFSNLPEFQITAETGKTILGWLNTDTSVKMTDHQRKTIFALGKELGKTSEETKQLVKDKYKLESMNDLKESDAEKLTLSMRKKVEENKMVEDASTAIQGGGLA